MGRLDVPGMEVLHSFTVLADREAIRYVFLDQKAKTSRLEGRAASVEGPVIRYTVDSVDVKCLGRVVQTGPRVQCYSVIQDPDVDR